MLYIRTIIFVRPYLLYYVKLPRNDDFPVFKWMAKRSRRGRIPILTPHSATSLAFMSHNFLANLTLLQKWFDRFDDSGLTFCLKVTSKFCPSAAYIFSSRIQPNTTSYTILTSHRYLVISPGFYILNFRRPRHGIVDLSSDSSLSCKLTWISAEYIHTRTVFWIAFLNILFPGLFYNRS